MEDTNHRANRVAETNTAVIAHAIEIFAKAQAVGVITTIRRRTPIATAIA